MIIEDEDVLEMAIKSVTKEIKDIRTKKDKALKKYEKKLSKLSDKLDLLLKKRTENGRCK